MNRTAHRVLFSRHGDLELELETGEPPHSSISTSFWIGLREMCPPPTWAYSTAQWGAGVPSPMFRIDRSLFNYFYYYNYLEYIELISY
jgi:hypothetical protein